MTGADACRLELIVDAGPRDPYPLRKEMTAGEPWPVDHKIGFDTDVVVKLWEEDMTSLDDLLGSHTIGATPASMEVLEFGDLSGGSFFIYRLTYSVTSVPGVQKVDHAISQLGGASVPSPACSGSSVWCHVPRNAVETRLVQLVSTGGGTPHLIAQGSTPFCGLAGIAYQLAEWHPMRLVRFCHALLDTGACLFATGDYEVSDDLRDSTVPGSTKHVEWLLCASLRESNHLIVDVEDDIFLGNAPALGDAEQVFAVLHAGWPVGLSELAAKVLGYESVDVVVTITVAAALNAVLTRPLPADSEEVILRRAGQARANNGLGLLLIDAGILTGSTVTTPPAKVLTAPGHYVACLTPSPISSSGVDMEVQSWGRKYRIQMSLDDLAPFIFGVIAVQP